MALLKAIFAALISNGTLAAATNSPTFDSADHPYVTLFGTATVTTTMQIFYSQDGITWYNSGLTIALTSGQAYTKDWTPAARYIAVQTSLTQTSGFYLFANAKGGS